MQMMRVVVGVVSIPLPLSKEMVFWMHDDDDFDDGMRNQPREMMPMTGKE